jgi:hypothetical protein
MSPGSPFGPVGPCTFTIITCLFFLEDDFEVHDDIESDFSVSDSESISE